MNHLLGVALAVALAATIRAQGDDPGLAVDRLAEARTRPAAKRELEAIGRSAVPALLAVLGPAAERDAIDAHALACLEVLAALGEDAAAAAPTLLHWVGTVRDREAGLALVRALGRIGPYVEDRASFEERFVSVAFDERPDHGRFDYLVEALFAISRIAIDPRAPLPVLLDIVAKAENPGSVIRAAELIAARAGVGDASVAVLRRALDRPHDGDLKFAFNYRNGGHTGSMSVGGDRSRRVRLSLARALLRLRPEAAHDAAVHVPLLRDGSRDEQMRAVTALAQSPSPGAVPALVEALASTHEPLVREAITALSTIGPGAKSAAPALRALATHASAQVRARAEAALRSVEERADRDR